MRLQPQSTSRSRSIVAQIWESQQIPRTCHGEQDAIGSAAWWALGVFWEGRVSRWLAHLCHDGAAVVWLDYTKKGSDEGWTVVRQSSAKRKVSLEKSETRSSDGDFGSSGESSFSRGQSWRVGDIRRGHPPSCWLHLLSIIASASFLDLASLQHSPGGVFFEFRPDCPSGTGCNHHLPNMHTTQSLLIATLLAAHHASAHGVVTMIRGANGVDMPGLSGMSPSYHT